VLPFVICARNFELAMALAESIHLAVLLIPEWRDQPPIRYAAANTELFPGRPNQRPRRKDLDGGRDGHVLISLGTGGSHGDQKNGTGIGSRIYRRL